MSILNNAITGPVMPQMFADHKANTDLPPAVNPDATFDRAVFDKLYANVGSEPSPDHLMMSQEAYDRLVNEEKYAAMRFAQWMSKFKGKARPSPLLMGLLMRAEYERE